MTVVLALGLAYYIAINIRWGRHLIGNSALREVVLSPCCPRPLGASQSVYVSLQENLQWSSAPPSVGLPFDWQLVPRWAGPSTVSGDQPLLPTLSHKGLRPFRPSAESPYAVLMHSETLQQGAANDTMLLPCAPLIPSSAHSVMTWP
jgi:hypothetical protein